MNNDNFFNKPEGNMEPQNQPQNEPTMTMVGEKQYSQEDLSRLVGLGETAIELEEKWNTKMDRLMPAFSEASSERAELKRRNEELESQVQAAIARKAEEGEKLTPEEEGKLIKEQAKKYGLVTTEDFDTYYQSRREQEVQEQQAQKLISDIDSYVGKRASEGLPAIDTKSLVDYMDETGISNFEAAYKLKFEKELDDWKMKTLSANKPSNFYTQSQSTAGAKMPEEKRVTSENLSSVIAETMSRYQ